MNRTLRLSPLTKKVLPALQLLINLGLRRQRWKRSVRFLLLPCRLFLLLILFLELGQKSVPIFALQLIVPAEFSLDHEDFNVVDRMHIVHAVFNNPANLLKPLVRSNGGNGIALHKHVAFGQELYRLQGGPVGSDQSLSAFNKSFFVSCEIPYLYDIAGYVIHHDFGGLLDRHASGEQLDQLLRLQNGERIKSLPRGFHCHRSLNQVQLAANTVSIQSFCHSRPNLNKRILRDSTLACSFAI
mmetsp:Transcript_7030/g.30934  ORF Transcript_7030/g.30934 Transcript_7030/m.30934 type:complete len:242 (+) Transcript_7030:962-1687(+)